MSKLKDALKVGIPIGAVFVGIQASAALATGSYGTNYYMAYGVKGLFLGLFQALFLFIFFFSGFSHIRSVNENLPEGERVYDYSSLASALYGKYSPVLLPLYELWQLLTVVVTGAGVIASGVTVLQTFVPIPTLLAAIIFGAVILLLAIFGEEVVRRASTGLSVAFFVVIFLFLFIIFREKGDIIGKMLTENWNPDPDPGFGAGVFKMFTLTCASTAWSIGIGAVAQKMTKRSHAVAAALTAGIGAVIMMVATAFIVMPFCPDVLKDAAPIVTIVELMRSSAPALAALYYILLVLALVSTGGPALFVFARRFGKLFPATGKFKNRRLVDILLAGFCVALCIAMSLLGLRTIVAQWYQYLGYIGMTVCIVPLVIIWPVLRSRGVVPRVYKKK